MVKIPEVIYNSNLKKNLLARPDFANKITQFKVKEIFKDEFFSNSPPSIFIGSALPYPQVNVGVLAPPEKKEDISLYDNQKYWAENNLDIYQIMEFRSSLINSRFRTDVKAVRTNDNRFLNLAREIGMSIKPVDVEVKLKKKIKLRINIDDTTLPMGPRGRVEKLRVASNPKVSSHVDKVYFDADMKAIEGINYLSKHGFDENALSKLLSIGIMGQEKRRVLVPTRWSITSVDSMLGNELLKQVKQFSLLNNYLFFYGHYLGNHYFVLFLPEIYNYELFETYLPGSFWNPTSNINISTDFEPFRGRTRYAEQTAGGFYATRLAMLEYLNKIKRQGSCLIVRIETPDYWLGLGVFVVREAMRKTLLNKPLEFNDKNKAIEFFRKQIFDKFKLDISKTLEHSILLDVIKQKKIFDF
ncbi:hypothetical protein HYV88_01305 [Candidatus Woesearchaeota archaeon]|nr:hypothetical protein [Candidatus Woesearchaeota archaeon]